MQIEQIADRASLNTNCYYMIFSKRFHHQVFSYRLIKRETNMEKTIFVTVGTTQFDDLISIIADPDSGIPQTLIQKGFTKLIIQSGKSRLPTGE